MTIYCGKRLMRHKGKLRDEAFRPSPNIGEWAMRCWLAVIYTFAPATTLPVRAATHDDGPFDVVVYGATPAGVCASIAACREGATVCLIEPLELVGGMMSSGLSFSDSNQMARECLLGLFEEFHKRVVQAYAAKGVTLPYRVSVKNQDHWTYEPHVAEGVFLEMLREAGVKLQLGHSFESIEKDGVRIRRLHLREGLRVEARVFIDASYEGDLMAAAGVTCRVGREGPSIYNESLAGHQYPKAAVPVSPWSKQGALLPLMTGKDAGDDAEGDGKTMAYSFRLCLTDDPQRSIPIGKPADYDPAQFELLRRYLVAFPETPFPIDLYPIPGGKVDANNGIAKQISLALVGASWEWPTASPQRRREIWRQHRSYSEGLLWFLANDPAVPQNTRDKAGRYGLAKDEFVRFGNWPPVLYIREARRMVGSYVLTQHDVRTNVSKPDAIAVASFPIDSHDCQRIPTKDGAGFINEGTIFPARIRSSGTGRPYHIPYGAIAPSIRECDNLLVPVCLSASHVAFCSVRVEPTWMTLGQSSGIIAALAVREDAAVQSLDYQIVRPRLEAQNIVLTLPSLPETQD